MFTVSPSYIHNGTMAVSWKVSFLEWVKSQNPGKYNKKSVNVEAISAEEAIANAKVLWEEFKWISGSSQIDGKIISIEAMSIFPDGTEFILWRAS